MLHGIQVTALKEYLRYEDRNSSFFGLESRLPFLDYKMVQYGFSVPDGKLVENGWTKMPLESWHVKNYLQVSAGEKIRLGFRRLKVIGKRQN